MKNNKGISLITLLITVIILIIISSISIYNGINMIHDTRKKAAEDKLKVICSAILKDDSFLNFGEGSEVALSENDFDYMDLLKYYDENHELKVLKNELGSGDTTVITYTLNMKDNTNSKEYQYTFDYIEYAEKYNYNIEFDEANGVNRPIVVKGMVPLMPDGVTPVNDIYKDNWYSYKVNNPNFAKMKYQDRIYVWIPRFAYNIQSFYENRSATNVPSSAIQIVYLKETSKYMVNDEVVQGEYSIHPAFAKEGVEFSGIWIEEKNRDISVTLSTPLHDNSNPLIDLHMMTNLECGAAMYLAFSYDNTEEIKFDKDEYVAASLADEGPFDRSNGFYTEYNIDANGNMDVYKMIGDALYETQWDRAISNYPTLDKPYIIRKFSSSFFDFTNSDGMNTASYRGVIVVK